MATERKRGRPKGTPQPESAKLAISVARKRAAAGLRPIPPKDPQVSPAEALETCERDLWRCRSCRTPALLPAKAGKREKLNTRESPMVVRLRDNSSVLLCGGCRLVGRMQKLSDFPPTLGGTVSE